MATLFPKVFYRNQMEAESRAGTHNRTLAKSKTNTTDYQQKLASLQATNAKLKELWEAIKGKGQARKAEASQVRDPSGEQLAGLQKAKRRLTAETQQLTNSLNSLVNENNKLKGEVDASRNSRVIYSNVYKNLQKEIHHHEYLYKVLLIESLAYQQAQLKIEEKIQKQVKKLEKDIFELQGTKPPRRTLKQQKSRLDTGLLSLRQNTNSRDIRTNDHQSAAPSTKRDEVEPSPSRAEPLDSNPPNHSETATLAPLTPKLGRERSYRKKTRGGDEEEDNFEAELKRNYFQNVAARLRNICGATDLTEVASCWKDAEVLVTQEYTSYIAREEEGRRIDQEACLLRESNHRSSRVELGNKTAEEHQLSALEEELVREKQRQSQLQQALTVRMDINCSRLSDQQIGNHLLRIKRRGCSGNRQLDKLLESAAKQKSLTSSSVGVRVCP